MIRAALTGAFAGLLVALTPVQTLAEHASPAPQCLPQPRIAIIIDDLGYQLAPGLRVARLPAPVAVAVLPHTPYANTLASAAHARGKQVMLHLPMQALGAQVSLGPGGIYLDTQRMELRETLTAALNSVPHVAGVNNHMGSLVTAHPGLMRWLMEELADRQPLYWVDSRTTTQTVALEFAHALAVPALRRDVFLDHTLTPAAVAAQFARLKQLARAQGSAVGIGHPHAVTLDFLESALPALAEQCIRLVAPGELLADLPGRTVSAQLRPEP